MNRGSRPAIWIAAAIIFWLHLEPRIERWEQVDKALAKPSQDVRPAPHRSGDDRAFGSGEAPSRQPQSVAGDRFGLEGSVQRRRKEARRAAAEEEARRFADRAQIVTDPVERVEFAGHEARSGSGVEAHRLDDGLWNRKSSIRRALALSGQRHDGDPVADDGHDHYRAGFDAFVAARVGVTLE